MSKLICPSDQFDNNDDNYNNDNKIIFLTYKL